MNSLVSLIIPAFNAESTLERCLESVLVQSHAGLDVIVVDDGSEDDTCRIAEEYARSDQRVRVLRQDNRGASAARNVALEGSRGEYVMFVDADDYLEMHAVESMLSAIGGYDLCVCDSYYRNHTTVRSAPGLDSLDWIPSSEAARRHQLFEFVQAVWLCMFRRKAIASIRFDESLHSYEDWDYLWRVLCSVERVMILHGAIYHYVLRPGSLSFSPLDAKHFSCLRIPERIRHQGDHGLYSRLVASRVEAHLIVSLLSVGARGGFSTPSELRNLRRAARNASLRAISSPLVRPKDRLLVLLIALEPRFYIRIKRLLSVGRH